MNPAWHFLIMIIASIAIFFIVVRLVVPRNYFWLKRQRIFLLSLVVVVFGMFFGKYGATYGLPWWLYYPIPMLITVLVPPLVLKLKSQKVITYVVLSFLSAPLIHVLFSFFLGWTEYMPFWKIPFIGDL
jgi:hypothetical protein